MKFVLHAPFRPTGDQPSAIRQLIEGVRSKVNEQVLLGVTGSGKTFTMANIIASLQKPTLIISHNKTLAAQLYQEFRDFFPDNSVNYFVSYYDYYQPEAYVPQTDTYIEKETEINEQIDKLRLAATANLLTRRDTIVVASVSCIYNIGSPKEYGNFVLKLELGGSADRRAMFSRLTELQYDRADYGFGRGTFRSRGEAIDIFPAYEDSGLRIVVSGDKVAQIERFDPLTGKTMHTLDRAVVYPAKHYMTDPRRYKDTFKFIRGDLARRVDNFKKMGKLIEAQRIAERVNWDLEMIQEVGYVNGIENYSRYFDGRKPGEPPYSLLSYFEEVTGRDWLLFVDESHMTVPQIRGMYQGDRSRKQTLIDYGFRLPAALDNRPLRFDEFMRRIPATVYVSATPDNWETGRGPVVEQLVRPTGLLDPVISIRPAKGQIDDLLAEIEKRVGKKERVLVTTLTKRMAEDLSTYLSERGIRVHYLHADVVTLERSDILADLRKGTYDVVVGINLLREGLDLPEVSLVAVLDADKEGFLRSRVSLIQTMGRASRHVAGQVILYADAMTGGMKQAIDEVERRRTVQIAYNKKHNITPFGITKPIRGRLVDEEETASETIDQESLTPADRKKRIQILRRHMQQASRDLDFELAAKLRDTIASLTSESQP